MEAALVSAATGALEAVVGKLATLAGHKYARFMGVPEEIESLAQELKAMHAFLLKMSQDEDPDAQDKAWMAEVRELSYNMEDSIDDFIQRVEAKDAKPDGLIEKMKHAMGRMKARRRVGKKMEDLKEQIVAVGNRNARYRTHQAFTSSINETVDPRALAIFEDSEPVGIEHQRDELVRLLFQDNGCASTPQVKVVSVVGCGGMGKTTLANKVYQGVKDIFECRVFLSVSRNPDMMKILRIILSEVSKQRYVDTEAGSIQQLIDKIADFLADKRYLVVIDDIWDVKTWDVIKCAFPVANSRGVIITTTRMHDVAQSCSSSPNGNLYSMMPLNMMQSRQLFQNRLFKSGEDCPSHLKDVSHQILEKCAGLPLAIIAISGLLANKGNTRDQWDRVKESIGCVVERNSSVDGMIRILSLSYFDLPPHLKTCLLYLSIFPEDHTIRRKGLIRRWIAEGFIHEEDGYTVHELGERYFNELMNRSLIQPRTRNVFGKVVSCGVHDAILDFILSKSIEENFVTLVGVPNLRISTQSKARRLSLQAKEKGNSILPMNLVLSHVRSLNAFGDTVSIPSLMEFRYLRVLDFGGCPQLQNHHLLNIGRIFLLRYLNLRETGISELPEQIGYIRCLEMLDIRSTRVSELPASLVNLVKLVHLLTDARVRFPVGIVKMQAVEKLKQVSVFDQSFNFLQELGQLQNLRKLFLNFLSDSVTEDTPEVKEELMEAIVCSLRELGSRNLGALTIWYGHHFLQGPLCPVPLSVQILMTYFSPVPQVPNWFGSLSNLEQLRLEVDGVEQNDLCILGALPALLILDLIGRRKSEDGLRVSGEVGFTCLKMFGYYIPNEGMDLMFAAGSMPKLENLRIMFDADQTEPSIRSGAFDFGLKYLPCLTSVTCGISGDESRVYIVLSAITGAASRHPNKPEVCYWQ